MDAPQNVIAVVVTFCPDLTQLKCLLDATCPQVGRVVVVDNTPTHDPNLLATISAYPSAYAICLGDNLGIGYAHNRGMIWAKSQGAEYALLLDQDSVPTPGMVSKLLEQHLNAKSKNNQVAAVGPATFDKRTNLISYFIVSRFGFPFRFNPQKQGRSGLIKVGFLIASGTLINLSVVDKIGAKRQEYFIDHVDTEWCLRAKDKGFELLGVHDAILNHQLGDKVDRVWMGYFRHVPHHSGLRDYYMFRNTLLMLSDVRIPFLWQLHLVMRLFQFMIYFLVVADQRLQRLSFMWLGLKHGFKGVRGRLDPVTKNCSVIPEVSSTSP